MKLSLTNPIINEKFILSILYCLGKLSSKEMINIIKDMKEDNIESSIIMTKATLSSLSWQRIVSLKDNEYYLTENGLDRFKKLFRHSFLKTMKILDDLRVDVLNYRLRN